MSQLKLTLQENCFSFLNHSLSQAIIAEKSQENWKYAILNLVQAIELALKELLKKEHPILIFKNIDNPTETVSLQFAVARLQKISKIIFDKDDLDTISLASKYRNEIVHYEFSFKIEEIKLIYAKLIGFLQSFTNKYFKKDLNEIVQADLWEEALNIIEYSNELQKRAEERFKEENIDLHYVIECRRCHQFGFVVQDEIDTCYVCGDKDESGKCDNCEEYFYLDELSSLHEHDPYSFCEQCRDAIIQRHYDDEAQYYQSL